MKDLKYFINEFLKRNPDMSPFFGGIRNLDAPLEMLALSERVLMEATNDVSSAENDKDREAALKKLYTSQLMRKIFRKTVKSNNNQPEEFRGFSLMFDKPKDIVDREVNKIIVAFNRQI